MLSYYLQASVLSLKLFVKKQNRCAPAQRTVATEKKQVSEIPKTQEKCH